MSQGSANISNIVGSTISVDSTSAYFIDSPKTNCYVNGDYFVDTATEGLNARLRRIEQILGIIERDLSLEDKWPTLKKIGDRYDEAVGNAIGSLTAELDNITKEYIELKKEIETVVKLMDKL